MVSTHGPYLEGQTYCSQPSILRHTQSKALTLPAILPVCDRAFCGSGIIVLLTRGTHHEGQCDSALCGRAREG